MRSAGIGPICSSSVDAVLGQYKDEKILAISPSATNPKLTQGNDIFFRTIALDDAQALKRVLFVRNTLKAKKVAILHDRDAYGRGYAEYFRRFLEQDEDVEVVLFVGINPHASDFFSVPIRQVVETEAEGLI